MDTKEEIIARMKLGKKEVTVKKEKLSNRSFDYKYSLSKLFLSIILLFGILIFTKISDENASLIKENLLSNSMSFTTFNSVYEEYFGEVAPSIKTEEFVFSSDLTYTSIEKLDNMEVVTLSSSSVISALEGGIVVFIGDKEDFGYTVIVQGNDGCNIWYGNLENVSLTLYDYIEKEEIIGEAKNSELYIAIKNNDELVNYEDYKN